MFARRQNGGVFLRYDQAILKCCSKEQNITKANYSRKALTKGEWGDSMKLEFYGPKRK
jgi:hypothetical protein